MSINTLINNPEMLDYLKAALDIAPGPGGGVQSISAGDNIQILGTAEVPIVKMGIAGSWSETNNVVKSSAQNVLEWGTDGSSLSFALPLVDSAGVVSLPIAGTWAAGTNDVIKGSSPTALFWANDNSKTYTATAPVDVTGTVISLPIAGTYSASNNVVKGSSATALEWGGDGDSLTFSAPLVDTAGVVSLPISGTWSATNNVVMSSSATVLQWGTDANTVYTGTPPVKVSGNAISLTIGGSFVAGVTDVVKGSASNALVWGSDSNTVYTATAPVDVTGTVISLPIAGSFVAGVTDVVKGSSASALVWGADGDSLTFSLPLLDTAGVVSLPIAGSFVAGVTDVVKGSASNALVWGSDSNSGGTVTSVAATTDKYCLIGGTATTTPTVGLNVTNAGTNGQILSATANEGELEFINQNPGTVVNVSATLPLSVSSQTSQPNITLATGLYISNTQDTAKLDLNITNSPTSGFILSADATEGNMQWITPPVGTVTHVGANNYCAVSGVAISTPTIGLSLSPSGAVGTAGQLLSVSSVTNALSFVDPIITSAGFGLSIASGGVIGINVSDSAVNNDVLSYSDGALIWQTPAAGTGTVTSVAATSAGYCLIGGTPALAPTVGLNIVGGAGSSGQVLSATANANQLAFITPPAAAIATQIANITTLPVWTITCSSGAIALTIYEGYKTTTLGNMSTYNAVSGLYLSCTSDCSVGVDINVITTNFQLQPPIYTGVPQENLPYFNGILYNITTGYNIYGFWQINSDNSATWNTRNTDLNLNPPVTGDLLYLDILPFTYVNA